MTSQTSAQRGTVELEELSRGECLRLLAANNFGRLAVNRPEGAPLIRPVNYVFDERTQSVVFRTGAGSKFGTLVRTRKASFEIDGIDDATRSGWSVVIAGVTEEIVGRSEIERLAAKGLESWALGTTHFWVRIRGFTVSGRRISVAPPAARALNRLPPPADPPPP